MDVLFLPFLRPTNPCLKGSSTNNNLSCRLFQVVVIAVLLIHEQKIWYALL